MSDPKPENLAYEDFAKLDIRAGTIVKAEQVPKSKKLLKLEVDFGPLGIRTILAGIGSADGTHYSQVMNDNTLLAQGNKVVAVLNLAPRMMMGIQSNGMLLACHDENNVVWLLNPGPVPDGSDIG